MWWEDTRGKSTMETEFDRFETETENKIVSHYLTNL